MAAQSQAARALTGLALGPGSRRHWEAKASGPCEQVNSTRLSNTTGCCPGTALIQTINLLPPTPQEGGSQADNAAEAVVWGVPGARAAAAEQRWRRTGSAAEG